MSEQTIDIRPHPALVRAALAHCDTPVPYADDHSVAIPCGPGWDSNGNMTIPEGHVLRDILSGAVNTAILKYIDDTMVLPSAASAIRDVAKELRGEVADTFERSPETANLLSELAERLDGIARNLDRKDG